MSDWPNNSEAGSAADDPQIVAALGRFEAAWKAGENPCIEAFLADKSDGKQVVLFSRLLALEIDLRLAVGEPPVFAQLAKRFPAHIDAIRGVLEEAATIGSLRNGHPEPQLPADRMAELPTAFGRYRVMGRVGAGGFGTVFSAFDDELRRMVAIKVPHARWSQRHEFGDQYLAEARTLARLDHPHIVPVFDCGRTNDGRPFVVSKFIEGNNLSEVLNQGRPPFTVARSIASDIADALHYAHREGIVHRDVKPGNILVDAAGKAYLADFGMVLREEEFGTGPTFAGTPAYMSPEQARSEGHRVDGRSDVFSLGIVFYQMLTGRPPFAGDSEDQLLANLIEVEARPPRQIDDGIPRDLERICLKALSKRAADRYTTAKDMADDLRHWSNVASSSPPPVAPVSTIEATSPSVTPAPAMSATSDREPIRIVPKGLRSFDAGDSDFFLELLPGPRDRDGLPNSLRFWKSRIEETDPDATFSVGLIYGPSGCGKSSLIKAGLLPRLSANVAPVYIEATAHDTEARLLAGLQRRFPDLRRDDWSLVESMSALRKGYALPRGQKALIVIDQFEQWLHAHGDDGSAELVSALRQCDGARLQCIITVRDDFWLAVSRFLRELEIRLVEGHNSALADLFDRDHARRVLAAFGRAFGKLPARVGDSSKDAKAFLRQAVEGLSEECKVNCARLALFAEMMKGKEWTPAALKAVGGTSGVGVTFLEETFSASTAPPAHRVHQKAARTVLHALLPESGSDIKGAMRSHDELFATSKYADPRDFEELLHILDGELRLITPTDPQGTANLESTTNGARPGQKYYQLTHDYLVPSLRDWLTRKQKETREGRAALALADRASVWNARPENRQLPSLWQWLSFRRWTDKAAWTEPQWKMMRRAGRVHLRRTGITAVVIVALGLLGWDWYGRMRADSIYSDLMKYDLPRAPSTISQAALYWPWLKSRLQNTLTAPNASEADKLRARLALLPDDPSLLSIVYPDFLKCAPKDVDAFRHLLEPGRIPLRDDLWSDVRNQKNEPGVRLRAACALAKFDEENQAGWNDVRDDVASLLVSQSDSTREFWIDALKLVGWRLVDPLAKLMQEEDRGEDGRATATGIFAIYLPQAPKTLDDIVRNLDKPKSDAPNEERIADAKRRANLGVALVQMQRTDLAQALLDTNPDPTARSFLIERLSRKRIRSATLFDGLKDSTKPPAARQALILACGDIPLTQISKGEGDALVAHMEQLCKTEVDPGVRGAAECALRCWNRATNLAAIDSQLKVRHEAVASTGQLPAGQRWFVNSQKEVMVVVEPGRLVLGSAESRPIEVTQRFAIASKEVTAKLFRQFLAETNEKANASGDGDQPITNVTWYQAAHFCNWLSEKDGIPETQFCYRKKSDGTYGDGMEISPNVDELIGYRLSKVVEWEYAYRAGTTTTRFAFGDAEELAENYAWFSRNSEGHTHPVGTKKPNLFGLVDMDGNASEWCHDRFDRNSRILAIHDRVSLSIRQNCYSRGYEALGAYNVNPVGPLGEQIGENGPIPMLGSCGLRVARAIR